MDYDRANDADIDEKLAVKYPYRLVKLLVNRM
jgi:hypothetical protein